MQQTRDTRHQALTEIEETRGKTYGNLIAEASGQYRLVHVEMAGWQDRYEAAQAARRRAVTYLNELIAMAVDALRSGTQGLSHDDAAQIVNDDIQLLEAATLADSVSRKD